MRCGPASRQPSRRPARPRLGRARWREDSRFRVRPGDMLRKPRISFNPSRISSLVSAKPLIPLVRTVWRTSTASNQPQRRGRPVTVPNSRPRSPMRLTDLVVLLGRERPLPHPRRVGLADAKHVADRGRAKTRAGRRLSGHRVGGGHERIGAVVDIQQRALRAFEQDALAFASLLVEQRPHRIHVGQDPRRDARELVMDRRGIRPARARARDARRCGGPAAARSCGRAPAGRRGP